MMNPVSDLERFQTNLFALKPKKNYFGMVLVKEGRKKSTL